MMNKIYKVFKAVRAYAPFCTASSACSQTALRLAMVHKVNNGAR